MSGSSQTPYVRRGSLTGPRVRNTPSTMMGQLMGALNNSAVLDDLNLNIETFHGGFDCNVDEVIKHELSMDGSLDFNFSHNQVFVTSLFHSTTASPTIIIIIIIISNPFVVVADYVSKWSNGRDGFEYRSTV